MESYISEMNQFLFFLTVMATLLFFFLTILAILWLLWNWLNKPVTIEKNNDCNCIKHKKCNSECNDQQPKIITNLQLVNQQSNALQVGWPIVFGSDPQVVLPSLSLSASQVDSEEAERIAIQKKQIAQEKLDTIREKVKLALHQAHLATIQAETTDIESETAELEAKFVK